MSTFGLSGAVVSVEGKTALTNEEGDYIIEGVSMGSQTVTSTLENYQIKDVKVWVNKDSAFATANLVGTGLVKELGVIPMKARRDTAMLCLDGCIRNPTANAYNNYSEWNKARRDGALYVSEHDKNYCFHVANAMMNRYYGGTITEDECAFESNKNVSEGPVAPGDPELDLGHDRLTSQEVVESTLNWALQGAVAIETIFASDGASEPTVEQYKAYIDADRPILWGGTIPGGGHSVVVAGYRYSDKVLEFKLVNTDNDGAVEWLRIGSFGHLTFAFALIAPSRNTVGNIGRKTDPALSLDQDGDGVTNFDEKYRWTGAFNLDETKADTDEDDLPDGKDIEGWLFRNRDIPVGQGGFDDDNDGLRGEVDPDSDNGGVRDGDEDFNFDARKTKDETDPYDPMQPNADDIPKVKITLSPATKTGDKIKVTGKTTATFVFYRKDGSTDLRVFDEKAGPLTVKFTPEGGEAITVKLTPTGTLPTATWTGELEITSKTPVGKAEFQVKNGASDVEIIEGKEFYISLNGAKSLIKE